jgi:cytochrome b subunit of formate dehydrogenase
VAISSADSARPGRPYVFPAVAGIWERSFVNSCPPYPVGSGVAIQREGSWGTACTGNTDGYPTRTIYELPLEMFHYALLAYSCMVSISVAFFTGLVIWAVHPASMLFCASSLSACAVNAIIGVDFSPFSLSHSLIAFVAL